MKRLLAVFLAAALPGVAMAQGAPPPPPPPLVSPPMAEPPPPPPSYPPLAPMPQPNLAPNNLQPYQPIFVQPAPSEKESQHEFGLMAGEFFASAAVTVAATVAVYSALGATDTEAQQTTATIAALLYIGLIPAVTSLPAWLIGMMSDRYDPRLGPAIEAGSALSGVAVIIYIVADQADSTGNTTSTWKYVAGAMLVIGMPMAEVIALNVTKMPRGSGVPLAQAPPILPELPMRADASLGLPMPHTLVVALPGFHF